MSPDAIFAGDLVLDMMHPELEKSVSAQCFRLWYFFQIKKLQLLQHHLGLLSSKPGPRG